MSMLFFFVVTHNYQIVIEKSNVMYYYKKDKYGNIIKRCNILIVSNKKL